MLTHWVGSHGGMGVRPKWCNADVQAMFSFRHDDSADRLDLDVGFHEHSREDCHDTTISNRHKIARALGLDLRHFVFVRQVHGTDVAVVDASHRGMGATSFDENRFAADAVVTDTPDVAIAILVADCVPILFYDPVRRVVGAAHSGWRGTVGHVANKVIDTMTQRFGSRVDDIQVSIGPSIRRCCYEVDDTVADKARTEFSPLMAMPRFRSPGKYLFSMQSAIRMDLSGMGVLNDRIEDVGLCTACRVDHLFSHRREHGKTGRQLAVISLR